MPASKSGGWRIEDDNIMNDDWNTITQALLGHVYTEADTNFPRPRREHALPVELRGPEIVAELPLRTHVHADPMQDLDDIIANDPNVVTSPRGSRMLSDLLGRVISVYRNRVAVLKARVLNAERYPALIYEDTVYRMMAGANGVEIHVAGELRLTIK